MGSTIVPVFQNRRNPSNMTFDGEDFARAMDLEKSFTAVRHTD